MSNDSQTTPNAGMRRERGALPDCATNDGKRKIAISHTITDIHYEQMVAAFFGTANPVEVTVSRADVLDVIGKEVAPGIFPESIQLFWDPNNHDITLTGAAGVPTPGPDNVCYSVCLFQGIEILDNEPDFYVFTMGQDRNDCNTVVFKTLLNNNVQHYYDCSNENP